MIEPSRPRFDELQRKPLSLFTPFIRYIHFPYFKNLESNARITFDYPITAIVGPNGTNKSSILRALQGAPQSENIGNYWFETALDHIEGSAKSGERQRYYYGYSLPSGATAESIQARVYRRDPKRSDYFETDEPRLSDGMCALPRREDVPEGDLQYLQKTRWMPIQKSVIYLDFRQELPAYDIFMSFNWRNQEDSLKRKKDYIRTNAPRVNIALEKEETESLWHNKNRLVHPAQKLPPEELEAVSRILGREYSEIKFVDHEYFKVRGVTARIKTAVQSYSEAYAGSGEFATIMLVHQIFNAKEKSLILLDEPETSLHPGAQKELTRFLAEMCLRKSLQVVMSTHAPAVIEELPAKAVKVLDINPNTHRVKVYAQEASPAVAFRRLGMTFSPKTIIVEDALAKEFVSRAADMINSDYGNSLNIVEYGGSSSIEADLIPTQAKLNSSTIVILDGDQRPLNHSTRSVDKIPDSDLDKVLCDYGIGDSRKFSNSGSNDQGHEKKIIDSQRSMLAWIFKHVDYLPSDCNPESLLLEMKGEKRLENSDAAKERWRQLTMEAYNYQSPDKVTSEEILSVQKQCLGELIKNEEPELLVEFSQRLRKLIENNV